MTDHSTARALVEKLRKLIRQQRQDRGDMMNYGTPDPEIVEAADFIEQSLTPPEGDTVSEGVAHQVAQSVHGLTA